MKNKNRRRLAAMALTAVMTLSLAACGEKQPDREAVEQAIEEGTLTVEDALEKGWVDQAWVDAYVEENSVPAVSKLEAGAVGEFTTTTLSGQEFTREQLEPVTLFAFADPDDEGAEALFQAMTEAYEAVTEAGGHMVLCTKKDSGNEKFADAPFPVIFYNDSLQEAVGGSRSIIEEMPNTASWYVGGAFYSAWINAVDKEDLIQSAASFAEMETEGEEPSSDGMTGAGETGTVPDQEGTAPDQSGVSGSQSSAPAISMG